MTLYFDYNATCPLRLSAKSIIYDIVDDYGNPSSVHTQGRLIRRMIEDAREKISKCLTVASKTIVFTSGATEANNTIIKGFKGPVIFSNQEHDSVFQSRLDALHCHITKDGIIDLNHLEDLLKKIDVPFLVSSVSAHNETGVIQPLESILKLVKHYGGYLHVDAVQGVGRQKINWNQFDYVTFSGHKIGALPGVGCMMLKENVPFSPLVVGGGQERSFRSGTENALGIVTFGEIFKEALEEDWSISEDYRDYLEDILLKEYDEVVVIGKNVSRLPNTTLISMPYVKSETQVMNFDLRNICVSSGSACSSGKVKVSRTLKALGLNDSIIQNVLRISLPPVIESKDIDHFITVWKNIFNHCYLSQKGTIK